MFELEPAATSPWHYVANKFDWLAKMDVFGE